MTSLMRFSTIPSGVGLGLLTLFSALPAQGQGQVRVSFEIDIPALTARWDEQTRDEVARGVQEALAARLTTLFEFWEFTVAPRGSEAAKFDFALAEDAPNEGLLKLRYQPSGTSQGSDAVVEPLWTPAEFGARIRTPPWELKANLPAQAIAALITPGARRAAIHSWLSEWVPVGRASKWLPSGERQPPSLLLMLPKPSLSDSRFRLTCASSGGASDLYARGTGRLHPADSELDRSVQHAPVVEARATELDYEGQRFPLRGPSLEVHEGTTIELQQLRLGPVFLEEFRRPSGLTTLEGALR